MKVKLTHWHLLFSFFSIMWSLFLPHVTMSMCCIHMCVWLLGTCAHTHICACVCHDLNISMCVFVCLWVCLCMCVLPNNGSSLLSVCRFSKDSWVHLRSRGGSEVRHWCRWPLMLRPPSSSCQINQSLAEYFGEHDMPLSLPHTLSFCFPSLSLSVCLFHPLHSLNSNP